jgi:hypothetical protein
MAVRAVSLGMDTRIPRPAGRGPTVRILWSFLLVAGAVSCLDSDPSLPCACTLEFRFFTVTVLDASGRPAEGVTITVRRVSDGSVLAVDRVSEQNPGVYVILTDGNIDDVSEAETTIEVVGTLGDTGFTAHYVFNRDACQCHVNKVSGPETVQLVPQP